MSLFDSASLVVTPNGYKEDKLYSIKPTDGSGDLVVTRATTATRVNSAGLIEQVPYNLATYSEQFNNANWIGVNGGLGSLPVVTANATTAPDGTLTADLVVFNINNGTSSADISQIQQNLTLTSSIHTFSIYAKSSDNITRIVKVVMPSGNVFDITITADWQRFTVTDTAVGTGAIRLRLRGNESTAKIANLYLWGAQLVTGTSAKEYFPTTDRLDIPRLDYTNSSCPSILVEPQRTNLALRSEEFNNATWTTNSNEVTISANSTTAPDGTLTADAILTTTVGATHYVQQRTGSATAGTTYTMSIYVKKLGYDYCRIETSNTATAYAIFRFSTKELTIAGSQVVANSGKVTEMSDGWFRIQMSILPAASATWRWWVECLNDSGSQSFVGDITKGLYVWGFQFEVGANATSYIPTTSATVTRNADVISKTGISSLIGQTEGTIFADCKDVKVGLSRLFEIFNLSNTGTNIFLNLSASGALQIILNGATVDTATGNVVDLDKVIFKYTSDSIKLFNNGALIGSYSGAVSFSNALDTLAIGGTTYTTRTINGNIKLVGLWETALTDQECINLTTI